MRLGIDLLRVDELDRLSRRDWFLRFTFSEGELAYAHALGTERRREFLAGRFAAKEAVSKVLGTGLFQGVPPRDIHLGRAADGEPVVVLRGAAVPAARARRITEVTVSLTHKRELVAAVAVGW
jgi:holo-[acyl-carrier protein] synthase